MARLAQLLVVDVVTCLVLMFRLMVVVAGLRWSDIRGVLLHDAYRSFTYEGERLPGAAPGIVARFVIRTLSEPDDGRLQLVPEVRLPGPPLPRFDRGVFIDREQQAFAVFRAR